MGSPSTATWKQLLLSSIQANSHLKHSSYFQLATISSNSRPSNRTVVFRGFQDTTDKILINTDTRSRKIDDLKHCPFAEICWYLTETWEQFRISGLVDVIDETNPDPLKLPVSHRVDTSSEGGMCNFEPTGEQRERSWFESSPRSRLQYMAPTPGFPVLNDSPSQAPSLDPSTGPVPAFCVLVLDPDQVDYLNLKSNERLIFRTGQSVDGSKLWSSAKVNP